MAIHERFHEENDLDYLHPSSSIDSIRASISSSSALSWTSSWKRGKVVSFISKIRVRFGYKKCPKKTTPTRLTYFLAYTGIFLANLWKTWHMIPKNLILGTQIITIIAVARFSLKIFFFTSQAPFQNPLCSVWKK